MNRAAQALGRLGGKVRSAAKAAAAKANGKLGGRPRTKNPAAVAIGKLSRGHPKTYSAEELAIRTRRLEAARRKLAEIRKDQRNQSCGIRSR